MKSVLALLVAFAALASGQTAPTSPTALHQPSFVAVGAGFTSETTLHVTGGAAYLRPVTDSGNTLAYTSATFTSGKPTTVEPGVARLLVQRGPFAVYALGTAGVAMGDDNVGTVISGGGFAMFDLSKWVDNLGVVVGGRELKSTVIGAQPAVFFAVTYRIGVN